MGCSAGMSTIRYQGRSQYEAHRGTCLSHLRFDPSVSFKHSHHKDPEELGGEFSDGFCLSPHFFLATALDILASVLTRAFRVNFSVRFPRRRL